MLAPNQSAPRLVPSPLRIAYGNVGNPFPADPAVAWHRDTGKGLEHSDNPAGKGLLDVFLHQDIAGSLEIGLPPILHVRIVPQLWDTLYIYI